MEAYPDAILYAEIVDLDNDWDKPVRHRYDTDDAWTVSEAPKISCNGVEI